MKILQRPRVAHGIDLVERANRVQARPGERIATRKSAASSRCSPRRDEELTFGVLIGPASRKRRQEQPSPKEFGFAGLWLKTTCPQSLKNKRVIALDLKR